MSTVRSVQSVSGHVVSEIILYAVINIASKVILIFFLFLAIINCKANQVKDNIWEDYIFPTNKNGTYYPHSTAALLKKRR